MLLVFNFGYNLYVIEKLEYLVCSLIYLKISIVVYQDFGCLLNNIVYVYCCYKFVFFIVGKN